MHIDCPACGAVDAPTNFFASVEESLSMGDDVELSCDKCGATFEVAIDRREAGKLIPKCNTEGTILWRRRPSRKDSPNG